MCVAVACSIFVSGPEEDLPRKMECFEFVCRAPSEYYKAKCAPYPTQPIKPELGFIWTSLGGEIRPVPSQEEIFGLHDCDQKYGLHSAKMKTGKERVKEEWRSDQQKENSGSTSIKTEKKRS